MEPCINLDISFTICGWKISTFLGELTPKSSQLTSLFVKKARNSPKRSKGTRDVPDWALISGLFQPVKYVASIGGIPGPLTVEFVKVYRGALHKNEQIIIYFTVSGWGITPNASHSKVSILICQSNKKQILQDNKIKQNLIQFCLHLSWLPCFGVKMKLFLKPTNLVVTTTFHRPS